MKRPFEVNLEVRSFDPTLIPDFVALNREWIETHFALETMDLRQLEDPYETILNPGGEILFLLDAGKVVGTVALVPHGPNRFEIAKMAVLKEARGKGYGDQLMKAAVAKARERGAHALILLSNTILEPAISLYRKHGFQTTRLGDHPDYCRCNIAMELELA